MRIINRDTNQEVTNPDLTIGELSAPTMWASPEAYATIDNVTKFALADDDYEEVQLYHVWTADEIAQREEAERQAERQKLMNAMPETVNELADTVLALCDIIEGSE